MPVDRSGGQGRLEPVIAAFGELDDAAQSELRELCYPISYRSGDLICKVDMPPIGVFIIGEGLIKYGKVISCGLRPPVLRILGPGDLLGIEPLFQRQTSPSKHFARAMSDVQACFVSFEPFTQFLERHPTAMNRLCEQLVQDMHRYECRLAEWTCGSVKVNLARLLLCLGQRVGEASSGGRLLRLTRRDLADLANAHIDTITRILNQFKADGLIETDPLTIVLRDERGLTVTAAPLPACLVRQRE